MAAVAELLQRRAAALAAAAALFSGKVKKRKKVFPFNNLALLNLDFKKKSLKKVKKFEKRITATMFLRSVLDPLVLA